jgi:hypothetical protein
VCEHTHIPVSRRTPFPGGGELPKRYLHTHDPFVVLAFAAAATRTLRLGTGIALVPQRDPIVTAKSVASLDRLSGGRFVFGIGGAGMPRRWKIMAHTTAAVSRYCANACWPCRPCEPRIGRNSTANLSPSIRSGSIPNPSRSRIRRSCSAA